MALKFGTSGVRGLVTEMTDRECYLYTKAFLQYVKSRATVACVSLAGDLRGSTPRIMRAAAYAVREEGLALDYCGTVATPAVTFQGMRNDRPSIMVTGSHIPDDRNGIKFNMPWGEVLKADEAEISERCAALRGQPAGGDSAFERDGALAPARFGAGLGAANAEALAAYRERYLSFFPPGALAGLKVVFYEHSSVSRDVLRELIETLGATVVRVARSDTFVPVDTEAVEAPDRLAAWVGEHQADALATTDGDGDRPLLVDEAGKVIRGDVLGIVVAGALNADSVSAPVSCNTALEKCGRFPHTARTRIGSPYVISAMQKAVAAGRRTVVGYEANGGFLTATDITSPETGNVLKALPTRDAALPVLCALHAAVKAGTPLGALIAQLPERYTSSGLLREFPNALGKALIERFQKEGTGLANRFLREPFGEADSLDFTDGARITFAGGDVVHFRPSGNAPEFRCYTESGSEAAAAAGNERALAILRDTIRPFMEQEGAAQ
ncbi:MAG: phosphomannomutase [Kiritimatiellae bacterium]|nr:phosphomannomutase [Kiritimatiellia bacterium]